MNIDWNQFSQDMQNMAAQIQQIMPTQPNHPQNNNNQPIHFQPQPQPQQQQPAQPAAAQYMAQIPSIPAMPTIPIQLQQQYNPMQMQQAQNIPNNQQHFVNQMNNFAQQITAYSRQIVQFGQAMSNAVGQQPANNVILMDHGPQIQQQIIIHNGNMNMNISNINHGQQHQQQQQAQFIAPGQAAPFIVINNHQMMPQQHSHSNFVGNNNVIDLTEMDEDEEDENKENKNEEEDEEEFVPWTDESIPDNFKCPISLEIMTDPVLLSDGFCYERDCILDWLHNHNRSPMTNLILNNPVITTEHTLRHKIEEWVDQQWDKYHMEDMDDMEEHSESNLSHKPSDIDAMDEDEDEDEMEEHSNSMQQPKISSSDSHSNSNPMHRRHSLPPQLMDIPHDINMNSKISGNMLDL